MPYSFPMEHLAIMAILLEDPKNTRRQRRWSVHPLWKNRSQQGEFQMYNTLTDHEDKFFNYFKMSRNTFDELLDRIEALISRKDTNWKRSISPRERLAICLRYITTGDSFKSISYNYRVGHTTASVIVHETCNAIVKKLMQEAMPLPTEEKWRAISAEFFERTGFPNCVGAIDGKHIQIQAPSNSGSLYFNYKKTFSTVLLALVDAQYNFIAVDVGSYGKNSDGGILGHSNLGEALENGTFRLPPDEPLPGTCIQAPYVIVGDEAFPLRKYLMRPFPGPQLTTEEKRNFNYRLTIARRYVENTFGILTQKFRIYNRRIQATPDHVDYIVMATCILHNFIRKREVSVAPATNRTLPSSTVHPRVIPLEEGDAAHLQPFKIRDTFASYLSNS